MLGRLLCFLYAVASIVLLVLHGLLLGTGVFSFAFTPDFGVQVELALGLGVDDCMILRLNHCIVG